MKRITWVAILACGVQPRLGLEGVRGRSARDCVPREKYLEMSKRSVHHLESFMGALDRIALLEAELAECRARAAEPLHLVERRIAIM